MRKLLAFLVLLAGCGTAALPEDTEMTVDGGADAGPCGHAGERCCSAEEGSPCASALTACVTDVCTVCAAGGCH